MPEDVTRSEIVPFDEIVRRLKVCPASAYKAAKRGELPTVRIGRRLLVLREPFERLLRDGNIPEALNEPQPDS
jgi:hypothetical protein